MIIGIKCAALLVLVIAKSTLTPSSDIERLDMTFQEKAFCDLYHLSEEELEHPYSILAPDLSGRIYISESDIALMERCVMSEAGNQSVETMEAVATVILNRWQCPDKFADTISGVINADGQFSTADNGDPTMLVKLAVRNAIIYYNTYCQDLPSQVYYFRSGHYHDFGVPYCSMDDLYFSGAADMVL